MTAGKRFSVTRRRHLPVMHSVIRLSGDNTQCSFLNDEHEYMNEHMYQRGCMSIVLHTGESAAVEIGKMRVYGSVVSSGEYQWQLI